MVSRIFRSAGTAVGIEVDVVAEPDGRERAEVFLLHRARRVVAIRLGEGLVVPLRPTGEPRDAIELGGERGALGAVGGFAELVQQVEDLLHVPTTVDVHVDVAGRAEEPPGSPRGAVAVGSGDRLTAGRSRWRDDRGPVRGRHPRARRGLVARHRDGGHVVLIFRPDGPVVGRGTDPEPLERTQDPREPLVGRAGDVNAVGVGQPVPHLSGQRSRVDHQGKAWASGLEREAQLDRHVTRLQGGAGAERDDDWTRRSWPRSRRRSSGRRRCCARRSTRSRRTLDPVGQREPAAWSSSCT